MEMGFPFFFSLFTLPFSLAIESRGDAGTGGKANGKEIKKIMRLQLTTATTEREMKNSDIDRCDINGKTLREFKTLRFALLV